MSVQAVLICAPAAEQVLPCPAGSAPSFTNAYLLDEVSATLLTNNMQPVDFSASADVGLTVFTAVIGFWAMLIAFKYALHFSRRFF